MSYARAELNKLGGAGVFASYEKDSAVVVDPTTPANNYDGNFFGLFEKVGSPTTGPGGGLLVDDNNKARLAVGSFPWNILEGSIGGEFIRNSTSSFPMYYGVFNANQSGGAMAGMRVGATITDIRFDVTGKGTKVVGSSSVGVRHRAACTWDSTGFTSVFDEGEPSFTADTDTPSFDAVYFFFGGPSAAGEENEIFEAWYVP